MPGEAPKPAEYRGNSYAEYNVACYMLAQSDPTWNDMQLALERLEHARDEAHVGALTASELREDADLSTLQGDSGPLPRSATLKIEG